MEKNGRFLFSIIIPVYNVDKYLEETVESVLQQSIGFEQLIQLILVNDGSSDNSGDICERFQREYPDNIVYINKENGGVSSARNEGLKHALGDYVSFLDSDDKWDSEAFRAFSRFFEEHPETRIATGRFIFFGAQEGKHHLDYKYKETRVADITGNDYDYPEMSVAKTVFKRELLEGRSFDEKLEISEDLLFINQLLLDEGSYGVVREAVYYYRKREGEQSAIDGSVNKLSWYTKTPTLVFEGLIKYSNEKFGRVILYVQYLLLTDLQWRLDRTYPITLPKEYADEYYKTIDRILAEIGDDIIIGHKAIRTKYKAYILRLKYFNRPDYPENLPEGIDPRLKMEIRHIDFGDDYLEIRGEALEKYFAGDYEIVIKDQDGKEIPMDYVRYPACDWSGINTELVLEGYMHSVRLPLKDRVSYGFYLKSGDGTLKKLVINFGLFARLTNYRMTFIRTGDYLVKREKGELRAYRYSKVRYLIYKAAYDRVLKKRETHNYLEIRKKGMALKKKCKKPIWIVSDRSDVAGDNGEAFFSFLMGSEYKDKYDIYFLIDENSEDYERIKQIGPVLAFGSKEHLITQLAASKVISSSGDNWVRNPYVRELRFVKEIPDYDYVFLQHGIIKDDLSKWLHFLNKDISMFVTSAKGEYDSIVNGDYGYDEKVVKLTGLARFDSLENDPQKIVAITPTWRKALATPIIEGTSRRFYSDIFKETEFFRFYNDLINDRRILDVMKRKGYKGVFYLHPSHKEQTCDFNGNDIISVWQKQIDYKKLFRESSLMVTDYSSVAMDFAYLKKPVIYAQFDKEDFFASHTYDEGYFDYKRDGFGPVCEDYESTVSAIIKAVEDDCAEQPEYLDRIDKFYMYLDRNNCRRIVEEIEKL